MYTCCPICKTNFNVTEAQLQVAQGKVRCGSCKNVFNARQHIHYQSIKSEQPKTHAAPQTTNVIENTPTATPKPRTNISANTNTNINTDKESSEPKKPDNEPVSDPVSDIDAIFNALDSQLTSGTYIDIAKPIETDIREAAFDEVFDDDEFNDINENSPVVNTDNPFLSTIKNINRKNKDFDLDLTSEKNTAIQNTNFLDNENFAVDSPKPEIEQTIQDPELDNTLEKIAQQNKSENTPSPEAKNKQQHTFDFISLPDEPNLSNEAEEQLAAVNEPLSLEATNKLVTKTDNDALHQAIDNIIKVDNNITTPYEENDDDHFVIEMQTEPDVELVDENDIDRLFASTDNIKMSDLKFDNYKTNKPQQTDESVEISDDINSSLKINEPLDDEPIINESEFRNDSALQVELEQNDFDETSFNQQVESNVNPESFLVNENTSPEDNQDIESMEFNSIEEESTNIHLETEFDNPDPDIEEEIILSSKEIDSPVPHRLRDAVASFEQQPISTKKRLFYSFAAVLLVALAGFQLVLFKSTAFANTFPALQPLLVSMCQSLPCRYTGDHNRKLIKIVSRDVRLHPKIKGALLISATVANQASYTQPYPTILLKFTDLTGATVAQRYFKPTEYLGLLNKPFALMPSKKPIQLNIEILDPGSDAINFQFFFL